MSSFWETKYLSAERSIQFMQEAHADVLSGLHTEIESLQKQCSDYALRLSMQAATAQEKEEFDLKFKSYNTEYKKRDAIIAEQKKLIEERNKSIKTLQERIKTLEKKLETESSNKDKTMKELKTQLEAQSNQIANLTFQLHHLGKLKSINTATATSHVGTINNLSQINDLHHLNESLASTSNNNSTLNSARRMNSPKLNANATNSKNKSSIKHNSMNSNSNINNNDLILKDLTSNSNSINNFDSQLSEVPQTSHLKQVKNSKLSLNSNNNSIDKKSSIELLNQVDHPYNSIGNLDKFDDTTMPLDINEHNHQSNFRRSNSAASHSNLGSAHSDRSQSPSMFVANASMGTTKVLPPVVKRPSENMQPPDPKPFLQSAASTLHTRTKKDFLQRRTLISLPPIKPFVEQLNHQQQQPMQLAVESPHKMPLNMSNAHKSEHNQKNNSSTAN